MLSYWERQHFLRYDYIIIGSGIVGLSTALSLRECAPHATILVLERGILPTGASTKNAGFACIGSLTEILDDLRTMGESKVLELITMRLNGLRKLRDRLGDDAIGYAENGSYELISAHQASALDHLYEVNDMLRPLLHMDAFTRVDHKVIEFGFDKKMVQHVLQNNAEGQIDTGRMMRSLIQLCLAKNIEIKTGAEVVRMEQESHAVKVLVANKDAGEHLIFSCSKVAVCTNAFTAQIIRGLDIHPGRGQVLITKPIAGLKVKGIFHFDKGFYYFREVDGRILFGGGRNKDMDGERTDSLGQNELILNDLLEKLDTMILPDTHYEIDYTWSGIMAFGSDKFPIIKAHSPNIYLGVRMGGMGIAMGSEAGEKLAAMMNLTPFPSWF